VTGGATLWRAFPWDPAAAKGARFSPSFLPRSTGIGRFDLPADLSRQLYLGESGEHVVAELIHARRHRSISDRHLIRGGLRLSIVEVHLPERASESVVDLCTAPGLATVAARADRAASRHGDTTQPIARAAWDRGHAGLHWWSRFHGDWHTTVLFTERWSIDGHGEGPALRFGAPTPLTLDSPSVVEAARELGIELAAS